ncbi:hydrolase [Paracoccus sp. 11-3]|uniref:Hydrolase n=1 Tax=Paracoccus amoyensis TaxID=2760093 RepID=A0A926JCW5_9RHOB|nr:hydrolase [Paracoccus amoyensis]
MRYACACCGYLTLEEPPPGSFEICPVCGWEDDIAQFNNPDRAGGANLVSLNQARLNFIIFHASDERWIGRVRPPKDDEII